LILRPRTLLSTLPLVEAGGTSTEVEAAVWRQRALEAERRADQAQAVARAGLAPHLVQVLKETVVQELAAQRRELLKAQEEAALEIAAMIHRFDSVQVPLQERLHSYEARIQELEKELAALNEENRELLKLKIDMIRRQLEVERVHNRLAFIPN
jgi:chromosome segregation ATPase